MQRGSGVQGLLQSRDAASACCRWAQSTTAGRTSWLLQGGRQPPGLRNRQAVCKDVAGNPSAQSYQLSCLLQIDTTAYPGSTPHAGWCALQVPGQDCHQRVTKALDDVGQMCVLWLLSAGSPGYNAFESCVRIQACRQTTQQMLVASVSPTVCLPSQHFASASGSIYACRERLAQAHAMCISQEAKNCPEAKLAHLKKPEVIQHVSVLGVHLQGLPQVQQALVL